jgi:hypothetical protein
MLLPRRRRTAKLQIASAPTSDIFRWENADKCAGTMSDKEKQEGSPPQSNLERLRSHLKKDSLAGKLVAARIAAGNGNARPSLQQVVFGRVEELKRKHEPVPDKKA